MTAAYNDAQTSEYIIELKNITKTFPGVIALNGVNLSVRKGEVHAVCGENGAGKSTLCNIVTGIYQPTKGEMYWKGQRIKINHPSEALHMGIAMVFQERNLIPSLTGAQNICLGMEKSHWGILDERHSVEVANALLERVGAKVPLDVPVSDLGASHRQMIEILRALAHKPELLILDEPTASLDRNDIDCLFEVVNNIKAEGTAVIFISHKLEEVFSISDQVTVFRDGQTISTNNTCDFDQKTCIKHMINRDMVDQYPPVVPSRGEVLLEAQGVSDGKLLKDISLKVHRGEVIGVYGLVGAGRTEFAEVLFGLRSMKKGEISYNSEKLDGRDMPTKRIKQGIFLIPEDRRRKGLFSSFTIRENASIGLLDLLSNGFGLVKNKEEKVRVKGLLDAVKTKYKHIEQGIEELSGGNKQKVVIGRWVNRPGFQLLIMDEPTQGIDVGAKREVYNLMRQLVQEKGIGIMCISSELPELVGTCDRIYVFKEGYVTAEFLREKFNQEDILTAAL